MCILELSESEEKRILMKELYKHITIQIDKTENNNKKGLTKQTPIENRE